MNLTQRIHQNLRVVKRTSLAARSVQRIVEDYPSIKHARASHVELSLNCATAAPGIDRKHLLRVE